MGTAMKRLLLVLVLVGAPSLVRATPADELASPSQATRDAAAKQVRVTWRAPARAPWDALLGSIHAGDSAASVEDKLRPFHVTSEWGAGSGGSRSQPRCCLRSGRRRRRRRNPAAS